MPHPQPLHDIGMLSPRSPLRGGRQGGFSRFHNSAIAEAASRMTKRPQSSPTRLKTAPSRSAPLEPEPPKGTRKGSLGTQRWHDATWHRPITADRSRRPVGCAIPVNGSSAQEQRYHAPPPTAGMSAEGLAGGIASRRGTLCGDQEALASDAWAVPAAGVPIPKMQHSPVQMRSSLYLPPTGRRVDGMTKATTTLLSLSVHSPQLGAGAEDFDTLTPRPNHGLPARSPLSSVRTANILARRRKVTRAFREAPCDTKASGVASSVLWLANAELRRQGSWTGRGPSSALPQLGALSARPRALSAWS